MAQKPFRFQFVSFSPDELSNARLKIGEIFGKLIKKKCVFFGDFDENNAAGRYGRN